MIGTLDGNIEQVRPHDAADRIIEQKQQLNMGYYIFSFGIETSKIQAAFGSKDHALQKEVEANEVFRNYADSDDFGYETTTSKALVDIIQGNTMDSRAGFAYGYAVIGLCATMGSTLPYQQEIKLGYETDLINMVLNEDFGLEDLEIEMRLLPDKSNPFGIPAIEDWPLIGLIRHNELEAFKAQLASLNITDAKIQELEGDPDERNFAYEHLKGILENVSYCYENGLDLISFCH